MLCISGLMNGRAVEGEDEEYLQGQGRREKREQLKDDEEKKRKKRCRTGKGDLAVVKDRGRMTSLFSVGRAFAEWVD